jgi:hypothetical protein
MNDERAELRVAGAALCVAVVCALLALTVAMSGCALLGGTGGPTYPTQAITVRLPVGTTGSVQVERINPSVNVSADLYLTTGRAILPAVRHVDAINLHITAAGYQPYVCMGVTVPTASPTFDWALDGSPVSSFVYRPTDTHGTPCPPLVQSRPPARTGIVQTDRRALHDAQGPLHGLGLTFFWAYQGETTEHDRFIANLDWLSDPAFPYRRPDYLRMLAQVDWQGRDINPNDPNYEANLGKTIDDIYAHGMRVEVSIIGGPLSRSDAVSLAQKVARVLVGREHKVIDLEMANEWSADNKTDIDTMVAMVGVFKDSGVRVIGLSSNIEPEIVDGLRRSGGTALFEHSDRDPGDLKWRQVRQMRDCTAGSPFVMSMNEPPGPNSSLSTNDSPVQLGIMRATAHTQGCALSVLHVGDMVTGLADPSRNRHANLWEVPGLDAILQAVRRVDAFLPEGVENWQNTNQHGHTDRVGPHPLLADGIWSDGDDHGVDRAHGAVSGNAFVEVLLGVKDYVNLQAAQALAFDALDPATGTVTHYELGAGQSARLAGRGDTMAGYLIRGTFK